MITYRQAAESDMLKVARLHIRCFQGYFLTKFGEDLLSKYYLEFLKEDNLFIVALNDSDICGFAMGYFVGSGALDTFQRKYKRQIFGKLLNLMVCLDPLVYKKVFAKITGVFKPFRSSVEKHYTAGMLSICVDKQYRNSGIAQGLVEDFERALKENGVKSYALSVYKNNIRAIKFYEKMGFSRLAENQDELKYVKSI